MRNVEYEKERKLSIIFCLWFFLIWWFIVHSKLLGLKKVVAELQRDPSSSYKWNQILLRLQIRGVHEAIQVINMKQFNKESVISMKIYPCNITYHNKIFQLHYSFWILIHIFNTNIQWYGDNSIDIGSITLQWYQSNNKRKIVNKSEFIGR